MSIHLVKLLRGFEADGPGRLVLSVLRQWRPEDLKVSIISLMNEGPLKEVFEQETARLGGRVYTISDDGLLFGRTGLRVANLAKMIGATHLHAHLLRADIAGRRAARELNIPYFVTEHGIHSWKEKALLLRPVIKTWYRHTLYPNVTVCAISRRVGRQLRREDIPRRAIRLVQNGIELDAFRPATPEQRQSAREELGIPLDASPVILVIGSLTHRKSPETALRGFAEYRRFDGAQGHLVFAGDGPLRERLERLANRLWVEDAVHFLGQLPKPELAYAAADVLLHTATDEPFGLIVAEAMASGLTTIVRAGAGADELVPPPPCASIVDGEEPEAWGNTIKVMSDKLESENSIAEDCRLYAEKRFSVKVTARRYLSLYVRK